MGHRYKLDTNGCIGPLMAFEHISAPQTYILEQNYAILITGGIGREGVKKCSLW